MVVIVSTNTPINNAHIVAMNKYKIIGQLSFWNLGAIILAQSIVYSTVALSENDNRYITN
jgi:hypothetical protein